MATWEQRVRHHSFKLRRRSQTIVEAAQESYLRSDIACGSAECPTCPAKSPCLPRRADHYVIPDAATLIDLLEVFELPEMANFILLLNVKQQAIGAGNPRIAARLKALYNDPRRHCTAFDNLHMQATAPCCGKRMIIMPVLTQDEISIGSSVQACEKAAYWYHSHLQGSVPVVIVLEGGLTSQPCTLSLPSPAQGVHFMSAADYFERFWSDCSAVMDLVDSLRQAKAVADSQPSSTDHGSGRHPYPAHMGEAALAAAIAAGTVVEGVLQINSSGPNEGIVRLAGSGEGGGPRHIVLPSRRAMNRAVHGDTVAVRLLPQSEWPATPSIVLPIDDDDFEEGGEEEGADAGNGPHSLDSPNDEETSGAAATPGSCPRSSDGGLQPAGEVVGILQRVAGDIVVSLDAADERIVQEEGPSGRMDSVLCMPLERRMPKLRLRSRQLTRLVGQRFVVRLDGWERSSNFPTCHLVRILGPLDNLKAETEAILVKAGIQWQPFSRGALSELPDVADPALWEVPPEELACRRDLRDDFVCSIDPPGCTDVDDALGVRFLGDGSVEVAVHIADVTSFVAQGSLLDGEARSRGTTVYLVDRRLDMLPPLLSEALCSLRANSDRLAVSVIWTLSADLSVEDVWFGRTVIRSRAQLSYQQAQDILDGKIAAPGDELPQQDREAIRRSLQLLERLTALRRKERIMAGAMELESAELQFETTGEGRPLQIHGKEAAPATTALIAEMMIWANSEVALLLSKALPGCALLRRHPPPRLDAFQEIAELCERGGVPLDVSSSAALSRSLQAATLAAPDAATASLIKSLATRAMSQAEYFSTGEAGPGGQAHFGLALEYYTHFTSPIRRFADMVVHRQLLAAVKASRAPARVACPPMRHSQLSAAAGAMNEMNRASKRAQKDCSNLYFLMLLKSEPRMEDAMVYGVELDHVLLFVPRYHIRARVHLHDRQGLIRPPISRQGQDPDDPCELEARRLLTLQSGTDKDRICIIRRDTGEVVETLHRMQRVRVELSCSSSRSHGPILRVTLISRTHPDAQRRVAMLPLRAAKTRTHLPDNDPSVANLHKLPGNAQQSAVAPSSRQSSHLSQAATSALKKYGQADPEHSLAVRSLEQDLAGLGLSENGIVHAGEPHDRSATPAQGAASPSTPTILKEGSVEVAEEGLMLCALKLRLWRMQALVSRLTMQAAARSKAVHGDHPMQQVLRDACSHVSALRSRLGQVVECP